MSKKSTEDNLEKTEIEIKHEFDKKELETIANDLADRIQKRKIVEEELNKIKTEYKSKLQAIDEEVNTFSTHITQKYEMRNTPVYLRRNYSGGVREYLSVLDKSEILKEEPLTREDMQLKMKLDEEQQEEK